MPIVIDAGPPGVNAINVPYVSVTVCTPGTTGATAACQTIDHVVVDTGSTGLRLLNSALYSNLNLPAATNGSAAIGECQPFVIGTTWGSVRYADIYLGGEVARSVPIQDIGDQPGGAAGVPSSCSIFGAIQDTQAQLGSKGILGIGQFRNDCDACLTAPPISGTYYTCSASGCTSSTVISTQVVQNPVALFSQDNNGVLIKLPAVTSAGVNVSLSGTLYFGIGTQTNNQLGSATVYATDPSTGNFTTTYNASPMNSYIDSGSNALFFNDTSISRCATNTWTYCPTNPPLMTLSAINTATGGGINGTVSFSIVNADQLLSNASIIAGNIGGPPGAQIFAWGLPFFFGQPVFTAIQGVNPPAGVPPGPYFAY